MRQTPAVVSGMVGAVLGALAMFSSGVAASRQLEEVLRVRKLVIVDANGTDRIVIAAPVPDPQVTGKRVARRTPGAGIQVNDASGNERGGLAVLDDGSFVVGIDDERGRERAHLYFIPTRGAGLLLQDGEDRGHISMLIPSGGEHPGRPALEMTDEAGKVLAALPASRP
jgi:hypothetical protein